SLLQRIRLVTSQRKVLSQSMSLPVVGQEDAAQIWMIAEDHSKQIVGFAFVPIRGAPHARNARHVRVSFVKQHFQPDAVMLRCRKQMVVDFKTRLFFRSAIKSAEV